MDSLSLGRGKRWKAALAIAQCVAENPGCRVAVIGRSYLDWSKKGGEAELILRASEKLGGEPPKFLAGRRSIEWANGSRVNWYSGTDKFDQIGARYEMAWMNNLSRFNQRQRELLCTIGYNLCRRRFPGLGIIIETGDLNHELHPQFRDCEAWLLRDAQALLELNGGWGTCWQVRDSDAESASLLLRWGTGEGECRALIVQLPGAPEPMFCLKSPGTSVTWVGEPQRVAVFAEELERYRWDRLPWSGIDIPTIAEKSVSECVLIAEKMMKEGKKS